MNTNANKKTCIRILANDAVREAYVNFKHDISNPGSVKYLISTFSGTNQNNASRNRLLELIKIITTMGEAPKRIVRHNSNKGDRQIYEEQGRVFQSNPYSFTREGSLYIIGLNPNQYKSGIDPRALSKEKLEKKRTNFRHENMVKTIEEHTTDLLKQNANSIVSWSAYTKENMGSGITTLQKSFKSFFDDLREYNITPSTTPTTNIIFIRTNNEQAITNQFGKKGQKQLVDMCWKFHEKALSYVKPKVILAFSELAKKELMSKLGGEKMWTRVFSCKQATKRKNKYINLAVFAKKGVSNHRNTHSSVIVYATHPSTVDWRTAYLKPSSIVKKVLDGSIFNMNKNANICPAVRTPTKQNNPVKRKRTKENTNSNNNNMVNTEENRAKRKRMNNLEKKNVNTNTMQINTPGGNTNRLRRTVIQSTHPMQTRLKRKLLTNERKMSSVRK